MSRPFTQLAGVLLLIVAVAHAYRIYAGLAVTIGAHSVPMWASWLGAAVAALLALMIFAESRRG
jgi:hypothetical protein